MAITVFETEKIFKLDTASCSYVMAVRGQNRLVHLYYGAPVDDAQLNYLAEQRGKASFWAIPADETDDFSTDVMPMEYSGSGAADLRPCAVTTVDEDGDNVTDLRYDSYEILEGKPANPGLPATYLNAGDGAKTLKITLRDAVKDVYVDLYYTVFDFSPAIARWSVVRNEGKQVINVKRVMSGSLQFPHKDFDLMHMHGAWAREFNVERTPIAHTTQSVQSFRGSSSHIHNPEAGDEKLLEKFNADNGVASGVLSGKSYRVLDANDHGMVVCTQADGSQVLGYYDGQNFQDELLDKKARAGSCGVLPDGEGLVVYGGDLYLLNEDGVKLAGDSVTAFDIAPDGMHIAFSRRNDDGTVDILVGYWSGSRIINEKLTYKDLGIEVNAMYFSPNQDRLYLQGLDETGALTAYTFEFR